MVSIVMATAHGSGSDVFDKAYAASTEHWMSGWNWPELALVVLAAHTKPVVVSSLLVT